MMDQHKFNVLIVEVLDDLADKARVGRQWSEPKHGVVGDPLRDKIHQAFIMTYESQNG